MGKKEKNAAYDNIKKVLELMNKKKEPVISRRKIDKKSKKKSDVEQFLSKDRPKTVLDEQIASRRIKQALDAEYARVQEKSKRETKDALNKLVTKSTETQIKEQIALDLIKEKELKKGKSSTQQLLEYFEGKETAEQLLNRVPEYVDATPAVQKEIRELVKLGGYRNLAKQKSIVKKFIGGTAVQRQLLIDDIAATPQAQEMKKAMREELARVKTEKLKIENDAKAAKQKIADDKAASIKKIADDKAASIKKIADDKVIAKLEKEAKKIAAKVARGTAITAAQQKILDDKAAKDLSAQREIARLAQIETDRLAKVAQDEIDRLAEIEAEKIAAKAIIDAREANLKSLLAGKQTKIATETARLKEEKRLKEEARLIEVARIAAIEAQALAKKTAKTNFQLGKKANIDAEVAKLKKHAAKVESDRLAAIQADEDSRVDILITKMRQKGYTPVTTETKHNNAKLRKLAEDKMKAEDIALAAAAAEKARLAALAAPAPAPSSPTVKKKAVGRPPGPVKGKGFEQATLQEVGGGFNKSTLQYGAIIMI